VGRTLPERGVKDVQREESLQTCIFGGVKDHDVQGRTEEKEKSGRQQENVSRQHLRGKRKVSFIHVLNLRKGSGN